MSPHDHDMPVPGCYRCELNEDEVRDIEADDDPVPADEPIRAFDPTPHLR